MKPIYFLPALIALAVAAPQPVDPHSDLTTHRDEGIGADTPQSPVGAIDLKGLFNGAPKCTRTFEPCETSEQCCTKCCDLNGWLGCKPPFDKVDCVGDKVKVENKESEIEKDGDEYEDLEGHVGL